MQPDWELYARVEAAVDARLSGKRLAHVHSVAEYAAEVLAPLYGVDAFEARLAGLTHDWDKLLRDDEFEARYEELGMERPEGFELMFPILHSFTGAVAVAREFPELPASVTEAISTHTLGGANLSPLQMLIFCADILEPLRGEGKRGGVDRLRSFVGQLDLGHLYYEVYADGLKSLIDRGRHIHPAAFEIWNELVRQYNPVDTRAMQGDPNVVA